MSESSEYFDVEAFRDIQKKGKNNNKKLLILVKWEGYPESDNTWEPVENIPPSTAIDLLDELKNNKKMAKKRGLIDEAIEVFRIMKDAEDKEDKEENDPSKRREAAEKDEFKEQGKQNFVNGFRVKPIKSNNDEGLANDSFNCSFTIFDKNKQIKNVESCERAKANKAGPKAHNSQQRPEKAAEDQSKDMLLNSTIKMMGANQQKEKAPEPANLKISLSKEKEIHTPKATEGMFQVKYGDITINNSGIKVVKMRIDNNGTMLTKQLSDLQYEVQVTENPHELMYILYEKLNQAHMLIRSFQERVKLHNEKFKHDN